MAETVTLQTCPSCSRLIQFTHEKTNLVQCDCGSTYHRIDGQCAPRNMYLILQPSDSIQPGTEGSWNGRSFKVLGRVRAWIEEFVFNYWTIVYSDGQLGYLGEGYGLYAIYEEIEVERRLSTAVLNEVKAGGRRDLFSDTPFVVERQYTCYKWELEGEAYLPEAPSTFRTFEFAAVDGRRIEVMEWGKNNVSCFKVHYLQRADLAFKGLRERPQPVKTMPCKKCSKPNDLRAYPYAQSFSCVHCGGRHSLGDGGDFKLQGQGDKIDSPPNITLGTKGTVRGIKYEVIGYAVKEENNAYQSQWTEYTLYNAAEGFAFLSEYNGHWIYVRERGDAPVVEREHQDYFTYDGEPFQLFNRYGFQTVKAAGEFPYDLFNDDDKDIKEFISPPEVWIREKSKREGIVWFLGEHIPGKELEKAFGDNLVLPYKIGVGAVEPKGYVDPTKIAVVAFAAVVLLLFAHLLTTTGLQNRVIHQKTYEMPDSVNTVTFVTDRFELDKWRSNLQLDVAASVDNSWFELGATLVNAKTGTEYAVEQGVEYYHGYSDGESWSEGERRETAFLSQIPAGTYFLQIHGTRESNYYSTYKLSDFSLTVTYDTPNHRNFVVCLLALLAWPLLHWQLVQYNERNRWSNSPFSPQNTNE